MENISNQIAVIGMQGRFPGAANIEEFWRNLRDGVETISFFSDQEMLEAGIDPSLLTNPYFVRSAGVLDKIEYFDAHFFSYSPREAEVIDPQQRLFLECAWEVIEQAGYALDTNETSIGVFASANMNSYLLPLIHSKFAARIGISPFQILISNDKDFLPMRVSYKLNLKGPSVNVQTACSSSLVAIHQACQSLLNQECDMALAGGVSLHVPQKTGYLYQEGGIGSPDGHCRAFDAQSKGTTEGYGLGIVLLKRLEDALADGDSIHAVILGSAINNDGATKIGFTAPSVQGQTEVIAEALALAEVDPATIDFVEAHGTGTPLGDPIEVAALTQAYGDKTSATGYCALGSVKTNVGHLNAAAGVTGFIKAVLALKHRQIPPTLHFTTPNPVIDFAHSPFYVNTHLTEWPEKDHPRRAAVSSFGVGGTNAHVVLEESPPVSRNSEHSRPWHLLPLSAKTPHALESATKNLALYLKQHNDQPMSDIAFTLQVGRNAFEQRRFFVVQGNTHEAVQAFEKCEPALMYPRAFSELNGQVIFLFPGQGSQYVNMGKELYQCEEVFQSHLDLCAKLLKPHLELDLRTILYPEPDHIQEAQQLLTQTWLTQPALFALEYALAQLWISWGIKPQAMMGHSVGEYVAGCIAGVFSLENALALVAARGRLIQQLPAGAMLSIALPSHQVIPLLHGDLALAASNSPSLCTVSGSIDEVEQLQLQLEVDGIVSQRLHTSHAFHSSMLDAILEPFAQEFKGKQLHKPEIPFIANLHGTWIQNDEATDPAYWVQHLRRPVYFDKGLETLLENQQNIFLEVGPGNVLSTFARQHQLGLSQRTIISSLPHPKEQLSAYAVALTALGKLWLEGIAVDWTALYKHRQPYRIALPTYPFERKRYWIETEAIEEETSHFSGSDPVEKPLRNIELELHNKPISHDNYAKPQNFVEEQLIILWQATLGIAPIGVTDNFFELGGHSLLVTQIMARVQELFAVRLSLQSIFTTPTIRQLAQLIKAKLPDTIEKKAAPLLENEFVLQLVEDVLLLSPEKAQQAILDEGKVRAQASPIEAFARKINTMSCEQKDLLLLRLHKKIEKRQPIEPVPLISRERFSPYHPLSFFQQRYWELNTLDPLNVLSVYHLYGHLNITAIRQSFQEMIRRHEILRTSFVSIDNQPYQYINAPFFMQLPAIDISALDGKEQEKQVGEIIHAFNTESIDLTNGQLIRVALIHLKNEEYLLVIVVHHIAFDGWSQEIMRRELAILYNAYLDKLPTPLVDLPVQYTDFAYWQNDYWRKGLLNNHLTYWTNQLRDYPILTLPQDRPSPPDRTFKGTGEYFLLTRDFTDQLISLGQKEEVSLFTTLLAVFMVLLSQVTRQADIVVGTPFANRSQIELEGLIGLFINTILIRSHIPEDGTFLQCLRLFRQTMLDAYMYQDVPFVKVIEALQQEHQSASTPGIVQILFALQKFPVSPVEMKGLVIDPFGSETIEVRHDLQCYIVENAEGVQGAFQYKTDIFDAKTIRGILDHYQILLKTIVADPDQRILDLPVWTNTKETRIR